MRIKKFRKLIVNTSMALDKINKNYDGLSTKLRVGQTLINELHNLTKTTTQIEDIEFNPFYNELNVKPFLESFIIGFHGKDKIEAIILYKGFIYQYLPIIYQKGLTK